MKEREVTSQTIQSNWHRLPKSEKERIKMTEREMLTAIVNGTINEEVIAKAQAMIDAKDTANAKRREKPSKKALENAELAKQLVAEVLGTEYMTASTIGEKMGVKPQKATAIAKAAVEMGEAVVADIKVAGKGTQKGYKLA